MVLIVSTPLQVCSCSKALRAASSGRRSRKLRPEPVAHPLARRWSIRGISGLANSANTRQGVAKQPIPAHR